MDDLWMLSLILLWLLCGVMAFVLAGALRQLGLIALRMGDDPGALITEAGLDRGTIVPDATAIDLDTGEPRRIRGGGRPRMITFVTPSCLACRQLAPHLNEVAATRSGEFEFLVVCRGDIESCGGFYRMNRLQPAMLIDTTGEVEAAFDVRLTPFAYVVDMEDRVLIRGVVNDWRQIDSLLDQEGTLQPRDFEPTNAEQELAREGVGIT